MIINNFLAIIIKKYSSLKTMTIKPKNLIEFNGNNFDKTESNVIKKWNQEKTFETSLRGFKTFTFYDGPPFANGLPHYGHLLTGFIKDLFARYKTMRGNKVERKFGWDCHGLPAEMYTEKQLNISGKIAIEKYGIAKFNNYCEKSVLKYVLEWKKYIIRQARWVNFDNSYKTMDKKYMESVIWVFKKLYNKDLVYQSMKIMPYSWACETPVSDFETKIDNSYRKKQTKAISAGFKLKLNYRIYNKCTSNLLIVWTTTSWTLPSNLAIAISKNIDYILLKKYNIVIIIAKDLLDNYKKELNNYIIIRKIKGINLIGLKYYPIYKHFAEHKNSFILLHADFITKDNGTGIVHIAPGFGNDDKILCDNNNIQLICPINEAGKFTKPVKQYIDNHIFETIDKININLKNNNLLIKNEQYIHNYPHCWRTDTPLIYKAVPSWYIKVTAIKDKIIKNNKLINWIPAHIKLGLFNKWLQNAKDWSVSRNRFWGCPIPIWQSDNQKYPHIEVYGSINEIQQAFKTKVKNLHKPYIDTLVKINPRDPTGLSRLRRVPEILDCWFESGAMPYAQSHYPFENKNWLETHFPADFVVEYVSQTRGWFYTLIVLSTALFNKPPFLNCICHGVILGDQGKKLSKRLNNYSNPEKIFHKYGADAMRWFMISSPVMNAQELIINQNDDNIQKITKSIVKPFHSILHFFLIYSQTDSIIAKLNANSNNIIDKYILSKLFDIIKIIKLSLDKYNTIYAAKLIENFLEILSNWYIRRSRERFWRYKKNQDKIYAYNTLYSILHIIITATAPLMPMISEAIFINLNPNLKSVHLEHFPNINAHFCNKALILNMEKVRDACATALRIRNNQKIRIRQPLQQVTFIGVTSNNVPKELRKLVLDEINVKSWYNLDKRKINQYANYKIKLNFSMLAKRLTKNIKTIIIANNLKKWRMINNKIQIAGFLLNSNEFELQLEIKKKYELNASSLSTNDALVLINPYINQTLKMEGIARDIVRKVQQIRKNMFLQMTDKIVIKIISNKKIIQQSLKRWLLYIQGQTLSVDITCNIFLSKEIKSTLIENDNINLQVMQYVF